MVKRRAVKSNDVYRVARTILNPWCKANGFSRIKGGRLGWCRPVGKGFLTFWLQVSSEGWDDFAGGKFIVEFQRAPRAGVGMGGGVRHRLPRFLANTQLVTMKTIQNGVIKKLRKPARKEHFIYECPPDVIRWYEAKFKLVKTSYKRTQDIWLRYIEREDVETWATFLLDLLPTIVATMEKAR